ncbi:MAG: serine/threonine protein kinase [Kofleriaceae bacterium]|nr:serine/threonine protein kinase [Kofleriaceae bacterium]MBP9169691.1 serine/threonine protein kinase [Kofleriaceae bacterium]MBP9859923.1 serine/threonine protein kinase [Kofleriaceae bacterium]
MPQFWCPSCHQFYSETGYCPFDGARLSIPPDSLSHPVKAVSAHEEIDAAALALQAADQKAVYDRLVGVTLDGRYLIERKIGEGGMGVVFAARHLVIERPLAVKVLKREVARDSSTIKRFVQEAKAASRIGHPNIVDVTDFGSTPDGLTYSVMEYVDGKTLSATIKLSAPLPAERALAIAAQIAQALGAAHDKGIVHRDLKPENVFLINRDGRRDFVKIVDFGIAKVTPLDASGAVAPNPDGPRLTRAGAVFGTPEYMAPEQAAGRSDTDGRVDVYALGTILYEMLTGRVPHKSESMVRTLAMQMLDPIEPPSKVRPDLPIDPEFEAVVMKALAKKREQRYATMGEFLAAITGAAKGVDLAQPVSTSVTARSLSAGVLQPLPPGMASSPDATTVRPARESKPPPSKPPPPLAPTTATGDLVPRFTDRSLHDPVFVATATQEPRLTLEPPLPEPEPEPGRRWLLALVAILVMGGIGVGLAIALKRSRGSVAPPADAGPPPTDARTVFEYDLDGGPPPTDARVPGPGPRPRRDAGDLAAPGDDAGPPGPPGPRPDAGRTMGRTPEERGTVVIEVLTKPDGGILFHGTSYRGPAGTNVEEKRGTRMKLRCTLPGYQPGYVELVFDGESDIAICVMKRLPCIDGLKDPFQDCPD